MKRVTMLAIIAAATACAIAAIWFWALRPFGFASYLRSTEETDAQTIRRYWPHRVVEPEWVSSTPDQLMNWHRAELLARLSIVAVSWLFITAASIYSFIR